MANTALPPLGGPLLVRWSPLVFWCSSTAVLLALFDAVMASDAETLSGLGASVGGVLLHGWPLGVLVVLVLPSLIAMLRQRHLHFARLGVSDRVLAQVSSDFATVGAAGLTPKGSGTIGAVAALPAGFLLAEIDPLARAAALVVLTAISLFATARYLVHASRAAERHGAVGHLDPSEVVVDEYVGVLLSLAFVPWELPWVIAAFALFRLFDIWKPGPVGWADRRLAGTWGVMMDDVIAGLMGGLILYGVRWWLAAHGGAT